MALVQAQAWLLLQQLSAVKEVPAAALVLLAITLNGAVLVEEAV
jgi:hypothetical protein